MRLESKRASIPTLYLELGDTVGELLNRPEVAARWDEPSSLDAMTVGSLAAHLGRAFTTTLIYIQADDADLDEQVDIDASAYYFRFVDRSDDDMDNLNAAIVERANDDADAGPEAVRTIHAQTMDQLRLLLIGEPPDRGIEVFDGMVMALDDYLVTRMVEAVVHSDDLAYSLGIPTPTFAPDVIDLVLVALLGTARVQYGDTAVLRAFTRAERSDTNPLPVF